MRQRDDRPAIGFGPAFGSPVVVDPPCALFPDRRRLRCLGIDQRPGRRRDADAGRCSARPRRRADTEGAVLTHPLAPRPSHFPARAKRVIFLFMNGGPSHVDTFDPKPALERYAGQAPPASVMTGRRKRGKVMPSPFSARPHGQSGIEVTELFPHVAACIDEICVIRSMYTDNPNHEPSLLMMNSGNMQPIRPSLGSWLTFGLGTENQNLPGFVVLCPGKPVVGPQLWSNSFLPGIYQGTHIRNQSIDPDRIIRDVTNRHLSPPEQRAQLDLLQALNREHLGGTRPRRGARSADRVARDGLPHAVRGTRGV